MYKIITLTLSIIIVLFLIKSTLKIFSELSDPIPINGLEPPPTTHYGGIILDSNIKYFEKSSFKWESFLLFTFFKMLNIKTTEEEISSLLESKKHVSLEDIKKVIETKEIKVSVLKLTLEDIKKLKTPFIAQTKDNYFLIVEEFGETYDEDKILIVDPRYGKVLLKNNYFQKIYSNSILIIEKEELANE